MYKRRQVPSSPPIGVLTFQKRNKQNDSDDDHDDNDNNAFPSTVSIVPELIILSEINSNRNKYGVQKLVSFNTIGVVCWIGVVKHELFQYEAIVIAAPAKESRQLCTQALLKRNAEASSSSSHLNSSTCQAGFSILAHFLVILFSNKIALIRSSSNLKIGSITLVKDIRIGKEILNCDMPHAFTNNNTEFIVEFNEHEGYYEMIKDFDDQIEDVFEFLTKCSLSISILIMENFTGNRNNHKSKDEESSKKKGKVRKDKSGNVSRNIVTEKTNLKHTSKVFKPFKPVI